MTESIRVYKQDHIRIKTGGKTVRIDPFMVDDPCNDADIILITHSHHDHFSPDDIRKTSKKNTVLIVPESMKEDAERVRNDVGKTVTVVPGGSYDVDGLVFRTVPAYNIKKPFHPKSARWVGYIIETDEGSVYVAGDTDATDEAKSVSCDIALVPVGGTYTMDPAEAAELVNTIGPCAAIPVHYGSIVGGKEDGERFGSLVRDGINVIIKAGKAE